MHPDQVYPNDGEWFAQPEEDRRLIQEQTRKLAAAKPLIRDVVKRLETRIEFYKDIDNIPSDLDTDTETHIRTVLLYREIRQALQGEKEFIESMLQ